MKKYSRKLAALAAAASLALTGTLAGCTTCHLRETCSFRKQGTTCFAK